MEIKLLLFLILSVEVIYFPFMIYLGSFSFPFHLAIKQ